MASYNLVLDTRFNPFTYAEMLKPVEAATTAHLVLEDAYSEMETKANIWENMANELTDPIAYRTYKNYAADLESKADDLLRNGLNISSRKSMMDMRSRYSKEIVPIEQAFRRREELAKELRNNADKTMFYLRDARTMSLDDFLNNPALDYGQSFSGALLAKMTGDMATNLKTAMTGRSGLKGNGLPFQYEQLIQYGYTPEQIRFAIENPNDKRAVPVLNTIVQQAMDSSGMSNWATPLLLAQARAYATLGLYNAIGQTAIKDYKDDAGLAKFRADLEDRNNARQQAREIAAQQAAQEQSRINNRLNPLPLRDKNEITAANTLINNFINQGFLKKVGDRVVLTKKGLAEYTAVRVKEVPALDDVRISGSRVGTAAMATTKKKVPSEFKVWADKIGAGKYIIKGPIRDKNGKPLFSAEFNNVVTNHVNANKEGSYDTYHTTEYNRLIDNAYGIEVLKAIKSAASTSGNKLTKVKFEGKQWKPDGDVNIADLEGYTVSDIRYSKYGNTAILQKSNGSGVPVRVKLPAGIHIASEANISAAISAADDYGLILSKGKRPKTTTNRAGQLVISKDKKGNIIYTNDPLTPDDAIVFLNYQEEALSDMGAYGSQLVVPSTTKNEEYSPFNF